MASLRDKLKQKIKSRNQPETMQCFDQTSLNLTLIQGKYHLTELKIHCNWTNNKYNLKPPKLKCKWYNRTQKNYQQIIGIQDEYYQPSILDIGSIIEVTCIPQLPGVNYEGMPILLKSQPITLSPETQAEANRLQQNGKNKVLVNIKEPKLNGGNVSSGSEAIILIDQGHLTLSLLKFGQISDQVLKSIQISQLFPQIHTNRRFPKEITLKFNEQESCLIQFKNHQARDSFCLFQKLYLAKKSLNSPQETQYVKEVINSTLESKEELQKIQYNTPVNLQKKQSAKAQGKQHKAIEPSIKQGSTTDLLQLLSLKQEIKRLQTENVKISKQLQNQKQKVYTLQSKVLQTHQRLQNVSKNYFSLQQELKTALKQNQKYKHNENSKKQQLIYYKNQIKLLTDDKSKLTEHFNELKSNYDTLTQELAHYSEMYNNKGSQITYNQLLHDLKQTKEINQELKLKNGYEIEEKQKLEETLKNSKNLIEQIQSQKKYIQKKYQSLTNELSSPTISSKRSDRSNQNNLSSSFIFEEIPLDKKQSFGKIVGLESEVRQKEILQLKKQLKDHIEENNYLRSLLTKQKKSTSKIQLKLELMQAKKIVSRLSQAMSQKDMTIQNLKEINKDINRKNQQLDHDYQQLLQQLKQ